ncbi:MAG: hypothetical protein Q4E61_04555 [Alphaproteobacteria bacterium]|nr:hypothetical protein [Alphaproteobacteria bacterium]
MKNKLTVISQNGEQIEADVLLYFSLESTGKDYVLYTFGENDSNQMETIHASIIEKNGEEYKLETMPDEDWETVKELMREIIRNEEE